MNANDIEQAFASQGLTLYCVSEQEAHGSAEPLVRWVIDSDALSAIAPSAIDAGLADLGAELVARWSEPPSGEFGDEDIRAIYRLPSQIEALLLEGSLEKGTICRSIGYLRPATRGIGRATTTSFYTGESLALHRFFFGTHCWSQRFRGDRSPFMVIGRCINYERFMSPRRCSNSLSLQLFCSNRRHAFAATFRFAPNLLNTSRASNRWSSSEKPFPLVVMTVLFSTTGALYCLDTYRVTALALLPSACHVRKKLARKRRLSLRIRHRKHMPRSDTSRSR